MLSKTLEEVASELGDAARFIKVRGLHANSHAGM